jgi:hypothetical protein
VNQEPQRAEAVTQIRNDIMHFDPDPPDTKPLVAFLDWLHLP